MKITSNWLKEHLDTKLDENQIIEKLTDVGLEVESVEKQSGEFDDFIVAKILKAEKHPNADKLKVCDVDVGKEESCQSCLWCSKCNRGLAYNLCSTWFSYSKKSNEIGCE